MLYLDDRAGSGDLITYLRPKRIPVELVRLEYGDAALEGNGPGGKEVPVGVEIKRVRDAVGSMADGRFVGHQLPGLVACYRYLWLVVEGVWYPNWRTGILMVGGRKAKELAFGRRRFMYRELDAWLLTLEIRAGIKVRRTSSRQETAQFLADLHGWWTGKRWEEHRGHLGFHKDAVDQMILAKPSMVRRVAAQIPGIGWEKSGAVAGRFKTVEEMMMAPTGIWERIDGVGKVLAARAWEALHGRA